MKIVLIGAGGTLGTAVHSALTARGHDVVTVGRSAGDLRLDFTEPEQVTELYERVGRVDAVACAAGSVPWRKITEMTPQQYLDAFRGKVASQVELVRQGVGRIAERGSFTLITGVLTREPVVTGTAASLANGAVEAFVRAAAIEIAPQRVNAVSPTVFTESLAAYGNLFTGMEAVDVAKAAQAYVRSVEGAQTGQVYAL